MKHIILTQKEYLDSINNDDALIIDNKPYTGIASITTAANITFIIYWLNGRCHNVNGPAVTTNDFRAGEFWLNGTYFGTNKEKFYSSKEYKEQLLLINLKQIKNIS